MASKKRTNPQDAANLFIRCLLCDISPSFGNYTEEQEHQTLEYFDYKCPYTGEDIREAYEHHRSSLDLDHIIGHNRNDCGLHVYGNLVLTTKKTNSHKSSMDFKSFIMTKTTGSDAEKQARIKKIIDFMEETGFTSSRASYIDELRNFAKEEYDKIIEMSRTKCRELAERLGVNFVEVEQRRTSRYYSDLENEFWDWLSDRVSDNTYKAYRAAFYRILDNAEINFDNFAIEVHDRIPQYLSNGEKATLGNSGSGSGRAVLKKLDLFMLERDC